MYIKEITIEGFKSYAQRTVLQKFSKSFNAITGLNGSGKSNILDAICFVLGISNLSQVRVHTLQELVFQRGQQGIRKASVTIVFDNSDPDTSPAGYTDKETITVTRQIVIGGRNKYIINGRTAEKRRVVDLFRSVQLNVDNPNFLIMQGHITKVVKMRPKEILNLLEETAGTSLYETKKALALKQIKKKDNRLKEIQSMIDETILPVLERRKKEQEKFVEWSRNKEKAEELRKVTIAYDVVRLKSKAQKTGSEKQQVERVQQEIENSVEEKKRKMEDLSRKIKNTRSSPESQEIDGRIKKLENQVKGIDEKFIKVQQVVFDAKTKMKDLGADKSQLEEKIKKNKETAKHLETKIKQQEKLLSQKKDYTGQLINKRGLIKNRIDGSTSADQINNDSYSTQNQLMKMKKNLIRIESEIKKTTLKLKHQESEKDEIQRTQNSHLSEHKKLLKELKNREMELKRAESEVEKTKGRFDRNKHQNLKNQVSRFEGKIRELERKKRGLSSQLGSLASYYFPNNPYQSDPSYHGLFGNLFRMKDPNQNQALEIIAGGRIYYRVVETDADGERMIKNARSRVNIFPLNKVRGYTIPESKVRLARQFGAVPAISCIHFDEKFRPVMNNVFGSTFIAKTLDDAEKVAHHPQIRVRCVSLDGSDFSPSGTLSGGASRNPKRTILKLHDIRGIGGEVQSVGGELSRVQKELLSLEEGRERMEQSEESLRKAVRRKSGAEQSVKESRYEAMKTRLEYLSGSIVELKEKDVELRKDLGMVEKQKSDLESQVELLTSTSITQDKLEKKLKATEKELKKAERETKKVAAETKKLECKKENLEEENEGFSEELGEVCRKLEKVGEKLGLNTSQQSELEGEKSVVSTKLSELQSKQDDLNQLSSRLKEERSEIDRTLSSDRLNLEKLESKSKKIGRGLKECEGRLESLRGDHTWIEEEESLFGRKGGLYDFEKSRLDKIRRQLSSLETHQKKLTLHVNRKAMINYEQQKHEYEKLLKNKRTVEKDKDDIKKTIDTLDQQKEKEVLNTWRSVGKDFGRVFQKLLPGSDAKLEAVEGDYRNGLEIGVAFGGKWKDSLSELSGGQRSLLALSLILSLLLYRPAPMYILDEIDAALDPSHTRNIGALLKGEKKFKNSQFIVVSLKEGMFKNADVLFTTSFQKGQSCVKRAIGERLEEDEEEEEEEREERRIPREEFVSSSESESESESDSEVEDEDNIVSQRRKKEEFKYAGKRKRE